MKEEYFLLAVNGKLIHLQQVQKLAKKNKFSLDTPIEDMPAKGLNMILYGTADGASRRQFWKLMKTKRRLRIRNMKDWFPC